MNQYQGSVLYIDILGISALTQGIIPIIEDDFKAHKFTSKNNFSEQLYCAKLLVLFRRILKGAKQKNLQIAQLSDCAFIWSRNTDLVLNAAREIMWETTRNGILCRGGMAYGEIVEPEKMNRQLGHFVCGKAVSNAVTLESLGKGARIFIDSSLPPEASNKIPSQAFQGQKNPLDYSTVDEFLWWLYPERITTLPRINSSESKKILLEIMDLVSLLKHSPKFRWNAFSSQGRTQLAATIESISKCTIKLQNKIDYFFSKDAIINSLTERDDKRYRAIKKIYSNEINDI